MRSLEERMARFAMSVGIVMGGLDDPKLCEYLKECGVTNKQMDNAKESLKHVAEGFFHESNSRQN